VTTAGEQQAGRPGGEFPLDALRTPGPDTVEWLLDGWFGIGAVTHSSGAQPDLAVPPALVALHEAVARHPATFAQNRLTPLDKLETVESRTAFLVENQAVCIWSYEADLPSGDDPPVWMKTQAGSQPEGETLSRFLIEAILTELVIGHGRSGANGYPTTNDRLRVLEPLERLALGPWKWPVETTFYAGPGVLAMVNAGVQADQDWIWVAGMDATACDYLRPIVGQWTEDTPWVTFSGWLDQP
jgi:hypothetical protein